MVFAIILATYSVIRIGKFIHTSLYIIQRKLSNLHITNKDINIDSFAECCNIIEVHSDSINTTGQTEVIKISQMFYGLYTKLPELINERNHYVSNFSNGTYGIWWCRTEDRDQWVNSIAQIM